MTNKEGDLCVVAGLLPSSLPATIFGRNPDRLISRPLSPIGCSLLLAVPAWHNGRNILLIAVPGGQCRLENHTAAYEPSYRSLGSPNATTCCDTCGQDTNCTFAIWGAHGAGVLGGKCWLVHASTVTRKSDADQLLLFPAGQPVPLAPPPVYWRDAWQQNLNVLPAAMANFVRMGLNGSTKVRVCMTSAEPVARVRQLETGDSEHV